MAAARHFIAANAEQFILNFPRGPYTTARAYRKPAVLEFKQHVERIAESARLMVLDGSVSGGAAADIAMDASRLEPLLRSSWKQSIEDFFQQRQKQTQQKDDDEVRLTSVVTWSTAADTPEIHNFVEPFPPLPIPPVAVQIRGVPRANAKAKDSKWVEERRLLKKFQKTDENEIVLCQRDDGDANNDGVNVDELLELKGELMEGMSSNFFAVKGGVVMTANDGILEGTIRRLVLAACRETGVDLELQPPNLADIELFEEAFLTSTSRLVLPLDVIRVGAKEFHLPSKAVGNQLLGLVREMMRTSSDDL